MCSAITKGLTASAAVVRTAKGPFSLEKVDIEAPRPHEVLVRLAGVGICHTDLVCRDGFAVPMPIVLGHEGSGVVEQVGSAVRSLAPGDHVVLSFDSCGECHGCKTSVAAHCFAFLPRNLSGQRTEDGSSPLSQNGTVIHGNFFGQSSFATHAIARETNTIKVSKDLPLHLLGPLGCGIQTGAGAILNSLPVKKGDTVAIFGAGAVGLSAMLAALSQDVGAVIVIEPNAKRAALARELGAAHVLDPRARPNLVELVREFSGGGVDHAIDTTANPVVMAQCADVLRQNGYLALLGVPAPEASLTLNPLSLVSRGITIKSIIEGDADPQKFIPRMIELYQRGRFPFDRMVRTFRFDQINEAVKAAESGEAVKPVLLFSAD